MAQEDQLQRCSNSSSGGGGGGSGRSSKKQKQKKVPQRGLGVAQLEKIRLEEAQKKDETSAPNLSSPPTPSTASYSSIPLPNFHHNSSSASSSSSSSFVSFPSASPIDLPCSKSMFVSPPSVPNIDILHQSNVPLVNHSNGARSEVGWSPNVSFPTHITFPKMPNCEFNLEGENPMLDPPGIVFRGNLPYESKPNLSFPNFIPRPQQYHPPSLMVNNVSSVSSSSSVLNFQLEPPSNQSFYGNCRPMQPEEEKMASMKRPYPFSLENSPGPSFQGKIPPFPGIISWRSDESTSHGNVGAYRFDQSNQRHREGPLCSSSICDPNYSKKCIRDNGVQNGDFLRLAPPTPTLPNPISKFKQPSSPYLALHSPELPEFEHFPYQVIAADSMYPPNSSSLTQHQQPIFSFFPPAKGQNGKATDSRNKYYSEAAENNLDLNLKL